MRVLFFIALFGCKHVPATALFKADTVFSMQGKFKRKNMPLGTDSLLSYKVSGETKTKLSYNIRTISESHDRHSSSYKIVTQNIPFASDNATTVVACVDFNDLHLLSMHLRANTDSGHVKFNQDKFSGWSQLPRQERKTIDYTFAGGALPDEANTPWLAGLLPKKAGQKLVLPVFNLFGNAVKWKTYLPLQVEKITLKNKTFLCWKINAGVQGPPGYTSYHWYEKKTGRLIKEELVKEGSDVKFITELVNVR
ncbi:MAG TPA: hypothetical protein VD905_04310 [Flavobacteriales bacterium]|nr:hypothetical protein [Flavobacteriales bacterium]